MNVIESLEEFLSKKSVLECLKKILKMFEIVCGYFFGEIARGLWDEICAGVPAEFLVYSWGKST